MLLTRSIKQGLVLLTAVAATGTVCAAEDASGFYYGLSGGTGEVKARGAGTFSEKSAGGHFSLGYELLPNISAELRLHRLSGDVGSNSAYGFLRFSLPTNDYISPYIMVGGGSTEIKAKSSTGAAINLAAIDEPTAGAAIGVNLFGDEETALNLEISAYASDDIMATFYSIGFQHYFGGRK